MKSLLSKRPVLWFLFLFNLIVAVAAYFVVGGSQGMLTSVGMGVVALGAGFGLLKRPQESMPTPAVPPYGPPFGTPPSRDFYAGQGVTGFTDPYAPAGGSGLLDDDVRQMPRQYPGSAYRERDRVSLSGTNPLGFRARENPDLTETPTSPLFSSRHRGRRSYSWPQAGSHSRSTLGAATTIALGVSRELLTLARIRQAHRPERRRD
ncbi:MAG: hypothetical protein ACQSGP_17715 [Frankia sp.]